MYGGRDGKNLYFSCILSGPVPGKRFGHIDRDSYYSIVVARVFHVATGILNVNTENI